MYGLYCFIQTGLVIIEIVNKETWISEISKAKTSRQYNEIYK